MPVRAEAAGHEHLSEDRRGQKPVDSPEMLTASDRGSEHETPDQVRALGR